MDHKESFRFSFVPRISIAFLIFGILALILHPLCALIPSLADAVAESVGALLRAALGYLSALIPFSLAELLLVLSPVWITLAVLLVRHAVKKRGLSVKRVIALFLSFIPLIYGLFVFTLGVGYLTTPLPARMSLDAEEEVTAQELYETALKLMREAERYLPEVSFDENGESVMPFSHREMNRALVRAYRTLKADYPFISSFAVGTKQVALSRSMAYTGITGVYSFFTGEANLNVSYPDYANAFTAAHEMAHARGIARENEANFVAFLATVASDEAYLRYAGYTNLLQYVLNALYRSDRTLYKEAYRALPEEIQGEYIAYNRYLAEISGHPVRDLAESINNAYLEGVGTEGTASYGLVVRIAVAYMKQA